MISSRITIGKTISADTDNFVNYCKYDGKFAVIKGLFMGYDDSKELYEREIKVQKQLQEQDIAPKLLKAGINGERKGRKFKLWISEDAGLPIEDSDIPEANKLLDMLYDQGIFLSFYPRKEMFMKGFDDKIRVTDFKEVEIYDEPIGKHNRRYI